MPGFSDALELAVLEHLCGKSTWVAPAAIFVQLHSANPGENGTTGVFGDSTRKQVAFGNAAAAGKITSSATPAAQWNTITAAGTITHFSLWSAVTGGTCLFTGALAASRTVASGNVFQLDTIELTLD